MPTDNNKCPHTLLFSSMGSADTKIREHNLEPKHQHNQSA